MTHQPYLDWLLADPDQPAEVLSSDQAAALQDHLDQCLECRRLAVAWQSVEVELQRAPLLEPAPGFTGRWQTHLEVSRQRQHRRQSMTMFAMSLGLALILLATLANLAWPLFQSPRLLVWTYLYQFVRWASLVNAAQQFMGSVLRGAAQSLSPVGWIFTAGGLTLLTALWVVSYRALTNPHSISIRSEIK
jgi:hypothetical protein